MQCQGSLHDDCGEWRVPMKEEKSQAEPELSEHQQCVLVHSRGHDTNNSVVGTSMLYSLVEIEVDLQEAISHVDHTSACVVYF